MNVAWKCLRLLLHHPLAATSAILAFALAGGLAIRVAGADFCLPMEHCHADEHYLVQPVIQMLRTGDFNPRFFAYPTLMMYILLPVFAATYLRLGAHHAPSFLLAGRLTSAVLGTGTLAAIYLAGRRMLDRPSAALGALALAVMPLHVASSHFVTTDILAGLVSALVLLAAAAVADEGNHRHYRCLGLLCGLAGAAKYNALLVALNLPLAHWLNHRRERFFDWRLLRACGWLAAGFLVACPYALLDLPAFLDGLAMEVFHYREGHVGHEGEHNRTFYLLYLASRGFGPVLTGLGIFGLIAMSWQRERRHTLLVAFPVLYVIFLGSYKVRFVRNLMPALPYFSLWIGFGASQAFRLVRQSWPALGRVRAWKLTVPALALIVAIPLAMSLDETVARIEPDTRLEAKRWMERALPRGSTVYAQAWSVDNLAPGRFRISQDRWSWDYYVATDRLSRKYFAMKKRAPEKYAEVVEAFKHRPVAVFPGREENPFDSTASPTVLIFAREPARSRVRPPPAPVLPSPAPAPAAPSAAPVPAGAGRPQAGSSP